MAKKKDFMSEVLEKYGDIGLKVYPDGIPVASTAALSIDVSTGIGGIPFGRFTEIWGPEQSAKTSLCLSIARESLKAGYKVLFIDVENSLDFGYMYNILGNTYDPKRFIVLQPESAENALDLAEMGVDNGFDVIFFDSVGAISPSGHARGTLAPRPGLTAEIPTPRPRTVLTMADMGQSHAGHVGHEMAAAGDPHAGHAGHEMETSAPAAASGWADRAAPEGTRVLSYADLRSLTPRDDVREPERTIEVRLGGNMERYIWTIDGRQGHEARPVMLRYGERVRLTFVNETMMAHPMHLHGMFVQLENGQPASRLPDNHTVVVEPGASYSVLLTADEAGEWA